MRKVACVRGANFGNLIPKRSNFANLKSTDANSLGKSRINEVFDEGTQYEVRKTGAISESSKISRGNRN